MIKMLLILAIALPCGATEAPTLTKESQAPAIYKIATRTPRGLGGGTAFLIKHPTTGQVVAITNRHVCDVQSVTSFFELTKLGAQHIAKISRKSKKADLCLLEVKQGFTPDGTIRVLEIAKRNSAVDADVRATGYAMLSTFISFTGSFEGFETQAFDPQDAYMSGREAGITSFPVFYGNSGSPLMNTNGEVIGVMYAFTGDSKGLFVPLKALLYFLTNSEG